MNITEYLIKSSDNVITLVLEENDAAITGTWSTLRIHICDPRDLETAVVTITRTTNTGGVALSSGTLTIRPRSLTEDLSALVNGRLYRVFIKVADSTTNITGAYFGEGDSEDRLYFLVSDPP